MVTVGGGYMDFRLWNMCEGKYFYTLMCDVVLDCEFNVQMVQVVIAHTCT